MYVSVGDHNIDQYAYDGETWFTTKKFHEHPNYNPQTKDTDAAILELYEDIAFNNNIRPACLPENDRLSYEGKNAIVSGWGAIYYDGPNPQILHETQVKVISNSNCMEPWANYHHEQITQNMMC